MPVHSGRKHVPLSQQLSNSTYLPCVAAVNLGQMETGTRKNSYGATLKKAAKQDRAKWLEDLASSGDWKSIKKLRQGRRVMQGRLRNADGTLVPSHLRAQTLAKHLENVTVEDSANNAISWCRRAPR